MMTMAPRVIPIELFPGDYCLMCGDQEHAGRSCHMLEMHVQDGVVAVEPCGCENSVTAGRPGRYVVKVVDEQKE